MSPLPFGSTIGILGGGQLGRMLALAAAPLGFRCHIFCPDDKAPAAQVAETWTRAAYEDEAALDTFAAAVDVITYEFENIPVATAEALSLRVPLRPGARALDVSQDRLTEKDFLNGIGIDTAPYRSVESADDLVAASADIGISSVLKTRRFGYDGKGQVMLQPGDDLEAAFASLASNQCILEGFIAFEREVSVLVARGIDGGMVVYPVAENSHRNHILDITEIPAAIDSNTNERARDIAATIADALDYVGVLAVEMFVGTDGALLVNEIAPRVHNSGHWTIEGAKTSQFENHIRAVAGLPLGATDAMGRVRMKNLIGHDVDDWIDYLQDGRAHLHLYGKKDVREGRKMGHVTWVDENDR